MSIVFIDSLFFDSFFVPRFWAAIVLKTVECYVNAAARVARRGGRFRMFPVMMRLSSATTQQTVFGEITKEEHRSLRRSASFSCFTTRDLEMVVFVYQRVSFHTYIFRDSPANSSRLGVAANVHVGDGNTYLRLHYRSKMQPLTHKQSPPGHVSRCFDRRPTKT